MKYSAKTETKPLKLGSGHGLPCGRMQGFPHHQGLSANPLPKLHHSRQPQDPFERHPKHMYVKNPGPEGQGFYVRLNPVYSSSHL